MREIKFRIWDKGNEVMMIDWQDFKLIKTIDKDRFLRLGTQNEKWIVCVEKVEDYKPMQYTGLKDMDGTEIYEGDIVEFITERKEVRIFRSEVAWEEDCFLVKEGVDYYDTPLSGMTKDMIVIGNIYENPELLESTND